MKRVLLGILFILSVILYSCGGSASNENYVTQDTVSLSSVEAVPPPPPPPPKSIENYDYDTVSLNRLVRISYMMIANTVGDSTQPVVHNNISNRIVEYGTLVYKIDSLLTVDVTSRAEVRIIKRVSQETTESLVSMTSHTSTGVIRNSIIIVGDIMDMNLVSLEPDVFVINPISSGDQPVDENTVTEWLWGVTPKKVGSFDLILKATIKENGTNKDKIVFDKKINVLNKPKKKYVMTLEAPNKLIRFKDNIIKLSLKEREGDSYNVDWGGKGEVVLEFPDDINNEIKITPVDNYEINDDKSLFNYKWLVQPIGKQDSIHYNLKIIGDYDELILKENDKVFIGMSFIDWIDRFLDGAAQRWYWLFSTLLIPLYLILKKKYFPEKKIFRRKRKPTPKSPPKRTPKS